MYSQLYNYFENTLFSSQCDFKKGYSAQHCPLVMIENFKEAIDRGDKFSALLTDLSKAFETIHFLLPKLTVTRFRICQLKLFFYIWLIVHNY